MCITLTAYPTCVSCSVVSQSAVMNYHQSLKYNDVILPSRASLPSIDLRSPSWERVQARCDGRIVHGMIQVDVWYTNIVMHSSTERKKRWQDGGSLPHYQSIDETQNSIHQYYRKHNTPFSPTGYAFHRRDRWARPWVITTNGAIVLSEVPAHRGHTTHPATFHHIPQHTHILYTRN